jgi:hypothetical protein
MVNMNIEVGSKSLITTNNWFFAPDGRTYRAVFGTVKAIRSSEETLGVKTNAKSTNWYVEIGEMTLAGCQIFYAVKAGNCNTGYAKDYKVDDHGNVLEFERPSDIYNADAA